MCLFGGGSAPAPRPAPMPMLPPQPPIIVRAPEPTPAPIEEAGPEQSAPAMAGGNKANKSLALRIRRPSNAQVSSPINLGAAKVGLNSGTK
jgi:hypothetical protein